MTYETLVFIRSVMDQLSIPVKDPNFRNMAMQMVVALDELDKEIANVKPEHLEAPT